MTNKLEQLKKEMEEAKVAWKIKFKAAMEKAEFAYVDKFYKYNLNSDYDAKVADAAVDDADAAYDVFTKAYTSYNNELNKNNE